MDVVSYLTAPVPRWLALTAIVSTAVASVGGTYFYLDKKFSVEYEEAMEREIEATRKFYHVVEPGYSTPAEAVAALIDEDPLSTLREADQKLVDLNYKSVADSNESLTEVVQNVFTNAASHNWDPDAEEAQRDPSKPYILEHDEFYEAANNNATLTFFEGDGVLADEADQPIPDIDSVVGEDNLTKFGHGSRDPNVLYVRNEGLDLDFEIVRNEGKYTEQVMGFIQHEDRPHIRRFRSDE